jgi:hypothetical protein
VVSLPNHPTSSREAEVQPVPHPPSAHRSSPMRRIHACLHA